MLTCVHACLCVCVYLPQVLACFMQVTPANCLHSTSSSSKSIAEDISDLLSDNCWLPGTEVGVQRVRAMLQETAALCRTPDTVRHAHTCMDMSLMCMQASWHTAYTCRCTPTVCSCMCVCSHNVMYTGFCKGSCGMCTVSFRIVWTQEWPREVGYKVRPCLPAIYIYTTHNPLQRIA